MPLPARRLFAFLILLAAPLAAQVPVGPEANQARAGAQFASDIAVRRLHP